MNGLALDLYAGSGGWDEGARILGVRTVGLELEQDPCVTAVRAGHPRIRCDVSTYPTCAFVGHIIGLVGSPPCTTFSPAGAGAGRQVVAILIRALDELAAGKATRAARRKECQRVIGAWALTKRPKMQRAERAAWAWAQAASAVQVLEPLRYIRDIRPEWVCLEQVEAVMPIWRHLAHILRGWGYRAETAVLNSADYGVPQTRRRAVLIASRVRPVAVPEPTHEREPDEYALFARVCWVSMADALGWGMSARPSMTVTGGGGATGGAEPFGNAARQGMDRERAKGRWLLHTNRDQREDGSRQTVTTDRPAPSLTGKSGGQWVFTRPAATVQGDPRIGRPGHKDRAGGESQFAEDSLRVTVAEAALLQSFPADYPWHGNKTSQFLQVGNAVPPRLAAAVIGAATGTDWQTAVADHYAPAMEGAA